MSGGQKNGDVCVAIARTWLPRHLNKNFDLAKWLLHCPAGFALVFSTRRLQSAGVSEMKDASALVLKGQLQSRAVLDDFAALDFHIQLHNFGNAQIPQRTRGGLDGIPCRILPGLRTRADYFRYSVD
jgi:hypothetical protein